jgi:hypothetical protein
MLAADGAIHLDEFVHAASSTVCATRLRSAVVSATVNFQKSEPGT